MRSHAGPTEPTATAKKARKARRATHGRTPAHAQTPTPRVGGATMASVRAYADARPFAVGAARESRVIREAPGYVNGSQ